MKFHSKHVFLGLAAGSALAFSTMPAQAASFGNDGILFDKTTKVDFSFIKSQGAFKSTLFIVEAANPTTPIYTLFKENKAFDKTSPDFLGTCPKTVTSPTGQCVNWFTFEAGKEYSLLLDSGVNNPAGTSGKVYSTDDLNTPISTQAHFSFLGTGSNKYEIRFDDKGNKNDKDFNDFTVVAEVKVPEPAALAGLGVVAGALAVSRRRKGNAS